MPNMLSPNWITSRLLKIWIVIIFFCLTVYYTFSSPDHSIIPSISSIQQSSAELLHLAPSKERFIKQIVDNEIDGPFDVQPLAELCANQTALPGLIFKCEPALGGISNVRNIILNCLRFAIEAGATSFVLPTIQPIKGKEVKPMDHFFDASHFTKHLSNSCPQIKVIASSNDLWKFPSTSPPVLITPGKLTPPKVTQHLMQINPSLWVPNFFSYLKVRHPANFSSEAPVLVSLKTPLLLQWPLAYDAPAFVATFGRLLRLRRDVRELAAVILWHMNEKYQLGIESRAGITQGQFYGAHLRTAKDARGAGWTPFKTQTKNYIAHAIRYQLQVIYAASGNPGDLLVFAKKAKARGVAVTTKEQLLTGVEGEKLRSLGWDLRTCVDWEVMLRASQFGGIRESSWSWGIAVRRHIVDGDGTWEANLDGKLDETGSTSKKRSTMGFGSPQISSSPEDKVTILQTSDLLARVVQYTKTDPASDRQSQGLDVKAGAATDGGLRNGNGGNQVEKDENEDKGDNDEDEDEGLGDGADELVDDGADEVSNSEDNKANGLAIPAISPPSAKVLPSPGSPASLSFPTRPTNAASRLRPSSPAKAETIQADPNRTPAKQNVHQVSSETAKEQSAIPAGKPPKYIHTPTHEGKILDSPATPPINGTILNGTVKDAAERYEEIQQQLTEEDAKVTLEESKGKGQTFQDRFSILFGPVEEREIWFGAMWP